MPIPSESLSGLKLNDGWEVVEKLSKHPGATGGSFSCGYKVKDDKNVAYLKALDFSEAFKDPDPPRRLQILTEAYNFERDLLLKCKSNHLTKIVTPVTDGSIDVHGFPIGIGKVYYIIFELADGDIRKIRDTFQKIDLAFSFRALHNTAVGLEQLHRSGIAHQDLKPSNVMSFREVYKVGDLGRSSDINKPFWYDHIQFPGDRNYSPLEQHYGFHFSNDFNEKYASDMYLFGSLFYFFFSGLSASQVLFEKARKLGISIVSNFNADIPEWERVFSETLVDLSKSLKCFLTEDRVDDVILLVKYLCHPDPRKRGFPKNITTQNQQYSFIRFISKLDIFAKEAELGII
jgi:serine/threonine protein kinase